MGWIHTESLATRGRMSHTTNESELNNMGDQVILINHFREMYDRIGQQLYAFGVAHSPAGDLHPTWASLSEQTQQAYRDEAQRIITETCEDAFVRYLIVQQDGLDQQECDHDYEWRGGHSTPDGPTEPEQACRHCGAVNQED